MVSCLTEACNYLQMPEEAKEQYYEIKNKLKGCQFSAGNLYPVVAGIYIFFRSCIVKLVVNSRYGDCIASRMARVDIVRINLTLMLGC